MFRSFAAWVGPCSRVPPGVRGERISSHLPNRWYGALAGTWMRSLRRRRPPASPAHGWSSQGSARLVPPRCCILGCWPPFLTVCEDGLLPCPDVRKQHGQSHVVLSTPNQHCGSARAQRACSEQFCYEHTPANVGAALIDACQSLCLMSGCEVGMGVPAPTASCCKYAQPGMPALLGSAMSGASSAAFVWG